MLLAVFVSLSILCGYVAESRDGSARRRWWAASALAAGLSTLVKGPVGFIVPGLVLVVFFLVERRASAIRRMLSPLNFVVFFATVLPWFIGVTLQRPDFHGTGSWRRLSSDTRRIPSTGKGPGITSLL